jgi:hypothetical protein
VDDSFVCLCIFIQTYVVGNSFVFGFSGFYHLCSYRFSPYLIVMLEQGCFCPFLPCYGNIKRWKLQHVLESNASLIDSN